MLRRAWCGALAVVLLALLAAPVLAQGAEALTAMDRLSARLKAMQDTLGAGYFYDTINPGSSGVPSYEYYDTFGGGAGAADTTYGGTGYAARGLVAAYKYTANAAYLTVAANAFNGAYLANGGAGGTTWGDILLGQELGKQDSITYAAQAANASSEAIFKANVYSTGTAATTASDLVDAYTGALGNSGGAWLAGLAAQALAREGSTLLSGGETAGAVAAAIAAELKSRFGTTTTDFGAAGEAYVMGWAGIAIALAATGQDPNSIASPFLNWIVATQDPLGYYDDSGVGGGGVSDINQGTAYAIMAMQEAFQHGYWQVSNGGSSMVKAGKFLTAQVNDAFGLGLNLGFPGSAGAGILLDGFDGAPYLFAQTDPVYGMYLGEFAQYDGEALFGIASHTPEPGTWALFGLGLVTIGASVRRRRAKARG